MTHRLLLYYPLWQCCDLSRALTLFLVNFRRNCHRGNPFDPPKGLGIRRFLRLAEVGG
jgi:hypothetical protein